MRRGLVAVLVAGFVCAVATPVVRGATASDYPKSRAYVSKHGRDATVLQAAVLTVEIDLGKVLKRPKASELTKLAVDAQGAYDTLSRIRDNFVDTESGAIGDAMLSVFAGANDLKISMGALVAYAGNPSAATAAAFMSQFKRGKAEWNAGVRTIWRMAHKSKPPIV